MPRLGNKDMRIRMNRASKNTGAGSGKKRGKTDPPLTPLEMHPPKRPRCR